VSCLVERTTEFESYRGHRSDWRTCPTVGCK